MIHPKIILVLCICADFMLMSPHFLHACCSVKSVMYCVHWELVYDNVCGVGSNWLASVGSLPWQPLVATSCWLVYYINVAHSMDCPHVSQNGSIKCQIIVVTKNKNPSFKTWCAWLCAFTIYYSMEDWAVVTIHTRECTHRGDLQKSIIRHTHTHTHTHTRGIAVNNSTKDWMKILCQDAVWNIWRLRLTSTVFKDSVCSVL